MRHRPPGSFEVAQRKPVGVTRATGRRLRRSASRRVALARPAAGCRRRRRAGQPTPGSAAPVPSRGRAGRHARGLAVEVSAMNSRWDDAAAAGPVRSRSPRLRLAPDRRRDLAGRLGRRQHLGQAATSAITAAARSACCASRAAAPTSRASRRRTSPACGWTTSWRCSSARTWATRRWSTTSPTRCRSRRARARPSRRCCTASCPRRRSSTPTPTPSSRSPTTTAARDVLREVYGDDVVALAYRRPGFPIASEVARRFAAHPEARAILLEKHGTICWGATVKEAYQADDRADQPRRGGHRPPREGAARASAAWR